MFSLENRRAGYLSLLALFSISDRIAVVNLSCIAGRKIAIFKRIELQTKGGLNSNTIAPFPLETASKDGSKLIVPIIADSMSTCDALDCYIHQDLIHKLC